MSTHLRPLRLPALLIASAFAARELLGEGEPFGPWTWVLLVVRLFAVAWGGWLVVRSGRSSLGLAALAGVLLLALDMVVLYVRAVKS